MRTDNSPFRFIALTHILLTCTITTILTAIAIFQNLTIGIIALYGMTFCIFIFAKKYRFCLILVTCSLFSAQIYFKIKNSLQAFHANQEFLHQPCIIKAIILQKQTVQLDKDQTTLLIKTSNIYTKSAGNLQESKKILLLMPAKRAQKLFEGQEITIFKAFLEQPSSTCDYQSYMIKEGIWATTYISSQNVFINEFSNRSCFHQCSRLFSSFLHASTINLFNPLFLGKREKSIESVVIQHQSLYWGIAHHMARSGIHLVTLFGLFMALFHYARIQHFYRYLICSLLLFGYFEMSVSSVSFLRALCMIIIQIIGKVNKLQYSSVHALTLTTLFMVSCNPWLILFLDFQLSFGITAVIIWLFQAKWAKKVAFIPKVLIPS